MHTFAFIALFGFSSLALGLEVVVEISNRVASRSGPQRYAKLLIPEDNTQLMYLTECQADGSPIPEDTESLEFSTPFLKDDLGTKIYRLLSEPDLPWAISEDNDRSRRGRSGMKVGWFRLEKKPGVRLRFVFDQDWVELHSVTPLGFYVRSAFKVNVSDPTKLGELMKFQVDEYFLVSTSHNLIGKSIQPLDDVRAASELLASSRLFLAKILVETANPGQSLAYYIPLREVRPAKGGSVFVSEETELRKTLNDLIRAANHQPPSLDLSGIPHHLHSQTKRKYDALGMAPVINPIPTATIFMHEYKEMDLILVDEATFENAVREYAVVASLISPGTTVSFSENNFDLSMGMFASLPVRVSTASHFLSQLPLTQITVKFRDFLLWGMVHTDRMMDCALELEKQGMIQVEKP